MTSSHALIVGEALVDVVIQPDGSTETHPGGSPANVALGLGRLGRDAELLTALGNDVHGRLVRSHLEASRVTVAGGTPAPSTSVATAHIDAHGVATYDFDLAWALPADPVTRPGPVAVHTGSIAAVLEPGGSDVMRLLRDARVDSTITYDPNARPTLMGDPHDALARIEAFVELADVVKVSDEDLDWLMPGVDPLEVARQWASAATALVVVTRGGEGSVAVAAGQVIEVPSVRVDVVDTVGAGDSYMAGLIDGLWEADLLGAHRRDALAAAPGNVIAEVLERCARIAAITVSRAGANPPWSAELDGD
ncbi:carbohydrate kinase [Demequina sp.]|uniref:carbohydrate kinase family protein n=1 Tax=Demequina sp. TaxID=2050685 RepID=UPI0025BDBE28|nr:carbohydrate kinase [Demequina sp.]